MQFEKAEEKDGIRMSWNIWPKTKSDASNLIVPIGCLYSPLKPISSIAKVKGNPIFCKGKNCSGVLNPFCRVDFNSKVWVCPFCLVRNQFPISYNAISPDNIPAELQQNYSTVEYCMNIKQYRPVFVFVVDTCLSKKELSNVKDSLMQSFMTLPQNARVGLISFGKNINIYELEFNECTKSYAFQGENKGKIDKEKMSKLLGSKTMNSASIVNRFLVSVSESEFVLTSVLEDLQVDPWPIKAKSRAERSTGRALEYAISLLEISSETHNARIVLFSGGPATVGNGSVVGLDITESIRSHRDVFKGNAKYYDKATKFYKELSKRCCAANFVVDIFACSLDQIGLAEMKGLVENTGGYVILCESFTEDIFKESFRKAFRSENSNGIEMTFGSEFQVNTSREFKVSGAIGPMHPIKRDAKNVSESKVIGMGGTNFWKLGSISPNTTVAVYFDIANMDVKNIPSNRFAYIQFLTKYKNSSGNTLLRVATLAIEFADFSRVEERRYIRAGFDQEAACVLMARWAIFKAENEFSSDMFRWLDNSLIKLIERFATFTERNPETFNISSEFSFYPQFMFYLRRSPFMSIFNSSPDETAYYRIVLLRENVLNSITMVQPTLFSYNLDSTVEPVLLDTQSCQNDRILLLDTFFNVIVWHGRSIADWVDQKLFENPDYAYIKEIIDKAKSDAFALQGDRVPHPKVIQAIENQSGARHLVAKLNPSVSYKNVEGYEEGTPPVFTDDVSLGVFMSHLRNVVVGTDN